MPPASFSDLRETSGLVYSVSSEFDVKRTRGLYGVEYACDPSNVAKARTDHCAEPPADADRAGRRPRPAAGQGPGLATRFPCPSRASIRSPRDFIKRIDLDLPLDEPTRAARQYVKLTAADVRAAFEKYLRPGDFVQVTQGPEPK